MGIEPCTLKEIVNVPIKWSFAYNSDRKDEYLFVLSYESILYSFRTKLLKEKKNPNYKQKRPTFIIFNYVVSKNYIFQRKIKC